MSRLEDVLLGLGAAAVIALGLMIGLNVLLREAFGTQLPDGVTLVRELMVAAILLPLASATAARAHVSVEFITNRFPARARSWLIVMGSVIGVLALAPLLYAGSRELWSAISTGAFFYGDLNLPRWPGRLLFVVGILACMVRLGMLAVGDMRTIRDGGSVDDTQIVRAE